MLCSFAVVKPLQLRSGGTTLKMQPKYQSNAHGLDDGEPPNQLRANHWL
jgi:hypothetical protein